MRPLFSCLTVLISLAWTPLATAQTAEPRVPGGAGDTPGPFVIGDLMVARNLDPGRASAMIDFQVIRGMYETLVVLGEDGVTAEPGAAASWEVSDDGLTYTFHLREDGKWSDGSPVTAEDFVAGWFRASLADTFGDYASLHFVIAGVQPLYEARMAWLENQLVTRSEMTWDEAAEVFLANRLAYDERAGVEAVDAQTLRVTLARPAPYFLHLVTMPCFAPLPADWLHPDQMTYDAWGQARLDEMFFHDPDLVMCNGPYRLVRYDVEREVRLLANEHYHTPEAVGCPRIIFRAYDDEALLEAYENGEVDWLPSVTHPEHVAALLASERDDVHHIANVGTYYYQFNCRDEVYGEPNPFADRTVRLAFAHAMDREAIVALTGHSATLQGTFVPVDSMPGYDAPVDAAIPYDLERAAALLAEAGYPGGEGLGRVDLLANATGARGGLNVWIAELLRNHWRDELGLRTVILRSPDFFVYIEDSRAGDFHLRRAGWFGDYHDPTTFLDMLRSGDANNDAGYESDAFDALMDAADAELDPAARMALLREAEALLLQDAVVVPLYRYGTLSLFDPERVYVPLNAWSYVRLDRLRWVGE